jgi:hypothetical protein
MGNWFYRSEEDNENSSMFSPWSFIHFLTGILAYLWVSKFTGNNLITIVLAMAPHIAYESKDFIISYGDGENKGENSLLNSFGDLIIALFGMFLLYKLNRRYEEGEIEFYSILIGMVYIIYSFSELD